MALNTTIWEMDCRYAAAYNAGSLLLPSFILFLYNLETRLMKTFYREDIRNLLSHDMYISLVVSAIPLTCLVTIILLDLKAFWRKLPNDILETYLLVPYYAYAAVAILMVMSCLMLKRYPRTAIFINGVSIFFLLTPLFFLSIPIKEMTSHTLLSMWAPIMTLVVLAAAAKLISCLFLFTVTELTFIASPKPRK